MDDTVQFKRKITPIGGSVGITLPKELMEFLAAENSTELILAGAKGKHGRYIAIWKEK